jgi:hypothetical protein
MKSPGVGTGARVDKDRSPKNALNPSPKSLKFQEKPPRREEGEPRSIYDGQDRVGHIVQRGAEFVAYDRQRRPIGTYDTALDAAAAVMRRARGAS